MNDIFISVDDIVVGEGDNTATFVVNLDRPSNQIITIDYRTQIDTASSRDFRNSLGTISFAPGETTKAIDISLIDDTNNIEIPENFRLRLTNPVNGIIDDEFALATIIDNDQTDGTPYISVADIIIDEQQRQGNFFLTLSQASINPITVDYRTEDGTANSGSDYQAVNGQVIFLPGETAKTIPVNIFNDSEVENAEDFNFVISNPVNATIIQPQAKGIIAPNDQNNTGEQPFISASDIVVGEGDTTATFILNLDRPSNQIITIDYRTQTDTANSRDFRNRVGTISFVPGETTKAIDISLIDDTNNIEIPENFRLRLTNPVNGIIDDEFALATIIDNDQTNGTPYISVADIVIDEQQRQGNFFLTLTQASINPITVDYRTEDVTANSGSDYQAVNGQVIFLPGETAKTIPVNIFNDSEVENAEYFNFFLSNPVNANIIQPQAKGIIAPNDQNNRGGQPLISASDIVVGEGDTTATFFINLDRPSSQIITIDYRTQTSTANSRDFRNRVGTIRFAPGETTKAVEVSLTDDIDNIEAPENFRLRLTNPVNGVIKNEFALATIIDNDEFATPNISVIDAVTDETDGLAFVGVILDKASSTNVAVDFSTSNGSANSSDYQSVSGTLNFAPGETAKTVKVILLNDAQQESSENFTFNLSNANNGLIVDSQATVTINENDAPLLDTTLNRFQNTDVPGTYLFATEGESVSIRQDFPQFVEEGAAFSVALEANDNLIRFNRFQNTDIPGTYLFANDAESISIRQNFPQFVEEGVAFYAYGANSGQAEPFYRFQNTQQLGNYIFVNEIERQSILTNYPQFAEEGIAFEANIA